MRELNNRERKLLKAREDAYDDIMEEGLEGLVHFMEHVGFAKPHEVLRHAERFITPLSEFLSDKSVDPDDFLVIAGCLGFFIGEVFVQRYDGHWFVDEDPDSPYFAQYVVGQFRRAPRPNLKFPPISTAHTFLNEPPGRSLVEVIERIDRDLREAG